MQISGNHVAAHAFLRDLEWVMREHGVDDWGIYYDRLNETISVGDERLRWEASTDICCINLTPSSIRDYLEQQQREGEG